MIRAIFGECSSYLRMVSYKLSYKLAQDVVQTLVWFATSWS